MKPTLLLALLLAPLATFAAENKSVKDIPFKTIDGEKTSLKAYDGKVVLVVNVASKCGLTPQYKDLESVYRKYKDKGLVIVGFPCNDFGRQEPGTLEEIKAFCKDRYDVSFPMMEKVKVKGDGQHPLYAALTGKEGAFPGNVKWNFGKFLIGKDGVPLQRFEPGEKPDSGKVTKAIEAALAK
jgi:glutathione peroxidase